MRAEAALRFSAYERTARSREIRALEMARILKLRRSWEAFSKEAEKPSSRAIRPLQIAGGLLLVLGAVVSIRDISFDDLFIILGAGAVVETALLGDAFSKYTRYGLERRVLLRKARSIRREANITVRVFQRNFDAARVAAERREEARKARVTPSDDSVAEEERIG